MQIKNFRVLTTFPPPCPFRENSEWCYFPALTHEEAVKKIETEAKLDQKRNYDIATLEVLIDGSYLPSVGEKTFRVTTAAGLKEFQAVNAEKALEVMRSWDFHVRLSSLEVFTDGNFVTVKLDLKRNLASEKELAVKLFIEYQSKNLSVNEDLLFEVDPEEEVAAQAISDAAIFFKMWGNLF